MGQPTGANLALREGEGVHSYLDLLGSRGRCMEGVFSIIVKLGQTLFHAFIPVQYSPYYSYPTRTHVVESAPISSVIDWSNWRTIVKGGRHNIYSRKGVACRVTLFARIRRNLPGGNKLVIVGRYNDAEFYMGMLFIQRNDRYYIIKCHTTSRIDRLRSRLSRWRH